MTPARRGSFVAATWLIGLGVVFLVRQAMNLSWGEAWPLFVILVGVASFVSNAVRPFGHAGLWSFTWPVVWIAIGVVLLLSTTGRLAEGPADLIAQWWPVAAIALGVWFLIGALFTGRGPVEDVAIPLDGTTEGNVRIRFGAGELTTHVAAPGMLVDGRFVGGVRQRRLAPGSVELEQDLEYGVPWVDRRFEWSVGLSGEVPLDLHVEAGASRSTIDLSGVRARNVVLKTGASQTRLVVPRGAGATSVRAETGAASLTVEVPSGVAARIRTRMTLGSSQIDEATFPRAGDAFESPDYATASNRVDLDVSGGVGSVRVIAVP
jgi:hypothetical protein